MGPVDLRRAAPVRVVDSLRAAVRRGQTVRARRASARRFSAAGRPPTIISAVERLPTKLRSGFGSTPTRAATSARTSFPARIPTTGRRRSSKWFNTDAFALQPLGTYGNSPRNNIIGPGIFNFDMSIIRNFRFGTSKSLQFRLEAFNVLNQPVWNDPNTSMANLATFGTITSTRKPMRELQLGVKFAF